MVIKLTSPAELVVRLESKKTFESIIIEEMKDNPSDKKVEVRIKDYPFNIVLWEGESYDSIGDWKNSDVEARILEMIAGNLIKPRN